MTISPLRISLAGGGSDLPECYSLFGGSVTSFAINKYVYVHAKVHDELFQEKYRIAYSRVEHTNNLSEIQNDVVRSCISFLNFEGGLQISTSADLPARSGLGSSSALTSALLLALHRLRGETVNKMKLAEEAFEVERGLVGAKVGKQDHYSTVFGGLNRFDFKKNGDVEVFNIPLKRSVREFLESGILVWTEVARSADSILKEQAKIIKKKRKEYELLITLSNTFFTELSRDSMETRKIEDLLRRSWEVKKLLSEGISNLETNATSTWLSSIGLDSHKLLGAGGGGFFLVLAEGARLKLEGERRKKLSYSLDSLGTRSISEN